MASTSSTQHETAAIAQMRSWLRAYACHNEELSFHAENRARCEEVLVDAAFCRTSVGPAVRAHSDHREKLIKTHCWLWVIAYLQEMC